MKKTLSLLILCISALAFIPWTIYGRQTDVIPDFSTVGYKNGDAAIPSLPVRAEISLKSVRKALKSGNYADTTSYIQSVIDRVGRNGGGTVLMSNGTVQRPVFSLGGTMRNDGTPGKKEKDFSGRICTLFTLKVAGASGHSSYGSATLERWYPKTAQNKYGRGCGITEDYVPVGRFYVEVADPGMFNVGENVAVYRPDSAEWISDIGMDKIASNGRDIRPIAQWSSRNMKMSWTRCVTVDNCKWLSPVAVRGGARLYGYCITSGELCLIKNCLCERANIGFTTNGKICGPNVFLNCEGRSMRTATGPHQGWGNGTLYDCVKIDNGFVMEDRGNSGTGHCWQQVALGGTTIGTKAVINVGKVFYKTAVELYQNPAELKAAREEYRSAVGDDFKYVPLIGDRKPPLDYRKK